MRLLEDFALNGVVYEKNSLFYGIAQISKNRMDITVSNLKQGEVINSVEFIIYDNDAIKGLNLPEDVIQKLAKQGTNTGLDQTGNVINNNIPSGGIVGQAVKAGVNTAKSVFKQENNQIQIPLKANYSIFIQEQN